MVIIKTRDEIERIRESNQIVAEALMHIRSLVQPGISTGEINKEIEKFIVGRKAKPAFKGLYGFPASACISVQDEVVHGIPSEKRILKDGEVVGVDIGVELNGYFGDAAYTYKVGSVNSELKKLLRVTEKSLYLGIEEAKTGNRVGAIGHAVQSYVEYNGFNVVRELVGHGVGKKPHEEPQVPNFGKPSRGIPLRPGMVLAIEPMVNMGSYEVYFAKDEWTVKTKDGKPSAHYEHSVAITENGPEILSKLALE
jgi:methionyl aminopeptidase